MSIQNTIRIVNRVDSIATELESSYANDKIARDELKKLHDKLNDLIHYLNNLDQLKPDYNTNDINALISAITVHLDILKEVLAPKDYTKLSNGMKAVKTILKFHPTKYSFFTYILAWIVEFIYFI